jgi:hypothetical protein
MHWVEDKIKFERVFLEARTVVYTDSGRLPTSLKKLTFDDAEICTWKFADLLQKLMEWSGDDLCSYVVLDPDPVYYFHRLFGKYPVVEIERGIASAAYLANLNEGPIESPADALGTNWSECVILPPSRLWFIHALRSDRDDGGHLWVPPEWVDRVAATYPYATVAEAA